MKSVIFTFYTVLIAITLIDSSLMPGINPSQQNILTSSNATRPEHALKSLGYPVDAYLNFTQLCSKYGYPVEEHLVVTTDGYKLKLFRIPNSGKTEEVGRPVLAVHGVTDSADDWIVPGPGRGLGYLMVDAGYDVWFANYRGIKYSAEHTQLDPDTDAAYWKFSFDEMAEFDIPMIIDYIINVTEFATLSYVGHSQGATIFYAMCGYQPEYYNKINVMISLGGAVFMEHTISPLLRLLSTSASELETFLSGLGIHVLFRDSSATKRLLGFVCSSKLVRETLCKSAVFVIMGFDEEGLDDHLAHVLLGHYPNAASLQNLVHLGQGIRSKKFQRYDRGVLENLAVYGSPEPPEYDLSLVTCPVAVFTGKNDWLNSPKDAKELVKHLKNVVEHYVVPRDEWNHLDFMVGREAPELIGKRIIVLLNEYSL